MQVVDTTIYTNLFVSITQKRAIELAALSKSIRQLQDLAKYTDSFQNLDKLLPYDIAYLNRIYELQIYRAQIENFLDNHQLIKNSKLPSYPLISFFEGSLLFF